MKELIAQILRWYDKNTINTGEIKANQVTDVFLGWGPKSYKMASSVTTYVRTCTSMYVCKACFAVSV